ncbi:hypothetical protein GCM10023334_125920 [Nonomuraea thailandensis]
MASGGSVGLLTSGFNTLTAGQRLLIDAKAMRAAVVTTDTWAPAAGTDRTGVVSVVGPFSANRWIHLTPAMAVQDPFSRAVLISCTATGTTTTSGLEVRARRAYL